MLQILMSAVLCLAEAFPQAPYVGPWDVKTGDFGGAVLKDVEKWLNASDYPMTTGRVNREGVVGIAFDITAKGRAENCKVTISSGHPILDNVPCKLIERRARFEPLKSADGTPQASKGVLKVLFWLGNERVMLSQ